MRVLAVVLSCLLIATAVADARTAPRVATARRAVAAPQPVDPYAGAGSDDDGDDDGDDGEDGDRGEPAPPARPAAPPAPPAPPRRARGQSIGSPWSGRLQGATKLQLGGGAYLRRPHRTFGTKTTVEHVRRAVRATRAAFPRAHVLAIGDLSAEHGGWISEHSSHRSGRDVDLGLFYKRKPPGYPESFVRATDDNLDRAATWALLANLLDSHDKDGGVHRIFLDYDVQGLLYRWAQAHGVKAGVLDQIFQYPHGRGTGYGLVHHEPNHDNHLHVRFRCAKADPACY